MGYVRTLGYNLAATALKVKPYHLKTAGEIVKYVNAIVREDKQFKKVERLGGNINEFDVGVKMAIDGYFGNPKLGAKSKEMIGQNVPSTKG